MKFVGYLSLFSLLYILSACTEKCPINCTDNVSFLLIGYDTSELKSVTIKKFTANTNFASLTDSINVQVHYVNGDTTFLYAYSKDADIDSISDWEITVLSVNKTYKVTNLNFTGDKNKEVEKYRPEEECSYTAQWKKCDRFLSSYNINGNAMAGYYSSYLVNGVVVEYISNKVIINR